jgi:hypothetical protein
VSELPLRVPAPDPGVWARPSNAVADGPRVPAAGDRGVAAERMLSPQQIAELTGSATQRSAA